MASNRNATIPANATAELTKGRRGAHLRHPGLPYLVAGIAFAGASVGVVGSLGAMAPVGAPAVQLASLGSPLTPPPLGPTLCLPNVPLCGGNLFGPALNPLVNLRHPTRPARWILRVG